MSDGQPINDNPALQAKLEQPVPAPASVGDPQPAVTPTPAQPQEPAPAAPAPAAAPAAPAGIELPAPVASAEAPRWEPTGNETLDTVGELFEAKGYDGSTALDEFVEHGEISAETYTEMVERLGEKEAKLAYGQFKLAVTEMQTAAQAEATAVFEVVGGEAVWKEIAAWTKGAGLPDAERDQFNEALSQGGIIAQLAAQHLKERMMSDPNFKSRADLIGSQSKPVGGATPPPAEMLDRATYSERIRQAERRGDQNEINQIREAGKRAMQNNPHWRLGNPK